MQTPGPLDRFDALRNVGYFLLLCLAVMTVRSVWTFPVFDSDALTKTYFAAEIYRSGDWSLLLHNHHTMRWIEMVPQVMLHHAAGLRYELFYLLPLLVYSLYVSTLLYVLREKLKPGELLLLLALLFVEPLAFRTSSQLLNPAFGVLFAVLGTVLLVKRGENSYFAVIAAAAVFFLGYAAHISYLAFAFGGLIWLVFIQRSAGKSAAFLLTITVCLLAETLVFNALSDGELTLGRIEALSNNRTAIWVKELDFAPYSLGFIFFERWNDLPRFDFFLCMLSFVAAAIMIVWRKALDVPNIVIGLCLTGLAFAFLTTVTMVRLDPLWPLVPPKGRYLTPYLPFAVVMVAYAISILLRPHNRVTRLLPTIAALSLFLMLLVSPVKFNYPKKSVVIIQPYAFAWRAHETYMALADRVRTGEVLISGYNKQADKFIVLYRYPLDLTTAQGGLGVQPVQQDAVCLHTAFLVPFSRNYSGCQH